MAWLHWPIAVLAALSLAAAFAWLWSSPSLADQANWPEGLLVSLAAVSTVFALSRQLPWQNVLGATLIIAVAGGGVQALGVKTGIPFGPFLFMAAAGPKLFDTVPWAVPLVWVVVLLNARGVGRLILRPWRKTKAYGFWLIGLTAILATLFDLAFDPFASSVKHYWRWEPTRLPLTWCDAPVINFLSWAGVTLLILAIVTPLLIHKRLRKRSTPDYHPLGVWLGALLLFGAAAVLSQQWPAVAVDAAIFVVTAIFAFRGARW
jgi:uncharacterized membrane protein